MRCRKTIRSPALSWFITKFLKTWNTMGMNWSKTLYKQNCSDDAPKGGILRAAFLSSNHVSRTILMGDGRSGRSGRSKTHDWIGVRISATPFSLWQPFQIFMTLVIDSVTQPLQYCYSLLQSAKKTVTKRHKVLKTNDYSSIETTVLNTSFEFDCMGGCFRCDG